jgi:hypothetical protein
VEAVYQRRVFPLAPGVPERVTEPGPQREAPLPDGDDGMAFMVAMTGTRAEVLSHPVDVL